MRPYPPNGAGQACALFTSTSGSDDCRMRKSPQLGLPNYLDNDADNDGTPDKEEGPGDDDDDGKPNHTDPDDTDGPGADFDGDGITNGTERNLR